MSTPTEKSINLSTIKNHVGDFFLNVRSFVQNSIVIFKKNEAEMTIDEKVEKQHILTFVYGMATGIILYHFLIGAILIVAVIGLYGYSVNKTKKLLTEKDVKK